MEQSTTVSAPKSRYKSFAYRTGVQWADNRAGWLRAEGKPEFRVSSPPEFKVEAGVWTPEDLFVAAVEICTMTTFIAFAQRLNLPLVSYQSQAEGLLEFVEGSYRFTKVVLRPTIVVAEQTALEQAKKALHDAHHSCLIANSIRAEVVVEPVIKSGKA
jgi:organic hydroperoxide reductase OsmC/OhrA